MHSEAAESFKEEEQKLMLGTRAEAKLLWRPECEAKKQGVLSSTSEQEKHSLSAINCQL